ncbi:MAG: hypothetical protein JXR60_11235 [Bacteroidales bacterium]|nr:hypothetical protein [Bacteroidales bacterium]
MSIIMDNDYVNISYHESESLVEMVWKKTTGQMDLSIYQAAFNAALDYQENHHGTVKNFLSDIRLQSVLSPDYRKWFQETAIPRAISNGLERGAVIFEGNVFQKYYLNNIMNSTKKFGIKFKFFTKREEAIEWFKTA